MINFDDGTKEIIKEHNPKTRKYRSKDSKAFIEYSNYMDDIYKNIEECNPNKKH